MTDQTQAEQKAKRVAAKRATGEIASHAKPAAQTAGRRLRRAAPGEPIFKPADRPYLTDSTIVQDDIRRHYDKALAEIDAIDADLLAIATNANRDVESIRNREAVETAARQNRRGDLALIVAMAARALGVPDTTADQVEPLQLERQAPQLTLRTEDQTDGQ